MKTTVKTAPLTAQDFTDYVHADMHELHSYLVERPGWSISDVTDALPPDARGYRHQYVDLVMEGGGMLGIALVGYVYALEQVGIRFLQLGGTSAGSINALLMAAAGPRHEASTDWIIEQLANKNFYDFVDGDEHAREFTQEVMEPDITEKGFIGWLKRRTDHVQDIKAAWDVRGHISRDFGLHPGKKFTRWLETLLKEREANSIEALLERRTQVPPGGLRRRPASSTTETLYESASLSRLAIITADITTQTKVVFPEMAPLYWVDWRKISPALLVRASMSVPLFFQPYRCLNLPGRQKDDPTAIDYRRAWDALGYLGPIPEEALFVDGGIISNFPINVFHDNTQVPAAPTFGVKLGIDRASFQPTDSVLQYLGAIFDAARSQYDADFIRRNSDYRHLVHCLNVDGFNWLAFDMPAEEKLKLFAVGVRGAVKFLQGFDWTAYKELRAAKVEVVTRSINMTPQVHEVISGLDWPGGLLPSYMLEN
ncbi:patatin-like phospholipase family protein [Hymenobacter sp.]|jgi:NTE family protein|uniref:patatin-like phospholipase family protein n=1 Tax=Hymenobacter sp. TaxID=1898978 RepID=UPI002EDAEE7F